MKESSQSYIYDVGYTLHVDVFAQSTHVIVIDDCLTISHIITKSSDAKLFSGRFGVNLNLYHGLTVQYNDDIVVVGSISYI
jgi:hypothetical protein